jgi:hypothetical protein
VPVEAKPIFRPDVIRLPILGFSLPEPVLGQRPKLEKWAEIIARGSVDAHKVTVQSPVRPSSCGAGRPDR